MSRSYCFTLNNYTEEELQDLGRLAVRYAILGKEIGEGGTPHIQGYLELDKPQRLAGVKKLPGLARAHFERRMGTREEARNYCMKDGQYAELGDWSAGGQGARNDLHGVMSMIKEGKPFLEIFEEAPGTCSRHLRFMDRYRELLEKEQTREFRRVTVEAYIGDAGCGKTRKAMEENPGIFTVNPAETFPFEGYDGESAILIDDFYGDLKYHHLLRVLDGHQLRVNVKGSHRYAKWTKVIITSNKPPANWYQFGLTPALARRLSVVTTFCDEVGGNTETPTDDEMRI